LDSALIPSLVETRQNQGNQAAQRLFSSMILLSVLALLGLALLLGLLAPYYLPYLGSGFTAAKLRLTRDLLYILLPFIFFSGVAGSASALLNATEKFALPALAPLLTILVTILFVVCAPLEWGAVPLAGAVVAGSVLEAALLVTCLGRQEIRWKPHWGGLTPELSRVLGQFFPMAVGAFLMTSSGLVDQSMAAMLPQGSVSAMSYGNKIVAVVIAIATTALGTATLPYFSKMVAQKDWRGCRQTLKRYSLLIFAITVPPTLCLMVFSKALVRLFYQRGAFTGADTYLVSWVQICYSFQVPFYVLGALLVRFLSSVRRNDVVLWVAAVNLVLDIVLNLILMRWWGIAGIAMSSSLVCVVSLMVLGTWTIRFLARQHSTAQEQDLAPQTEMARSASGAPGHFAE